MTPLDQRKQCLMAFQCGATPTRQQSKAIIQPRRNLFRRKDLSTHGGELNRQRNAIQPSANICYGWHVLFFEVEGWISRYCTINKEVHTVILCKHIEIMELPRIRQRKRRHAV